MQKPPVSSAQVAHASQRNPNLLRDRLANERTFLAWLRTGIAIGSLGFVVARFDIFLQEVGRAGGRAAPEVGQVAVPVGVILLLAGAAVVLLAAAAYIHTERELLAGDWGTRPLVRYIIIGITLCSVVAGVGLAIHLLQIWPA